MTFSSVLDTSHTKLSLIGFIGTLSLEWLINGQAVEVKRVIMTSGQGPRSLLAGRVEPFVKLVPLLVGGLGRFQVINVVALFEVNELAETIQRKLDRVQRHRGCYLVN